MFKLFHNCISYFYNVYTAYCTPISRVVSDRKLILIDNLWYQKHYKWINLMDQHFEGYP